MSFRVYNRYLFPRPTLVHDSGLSLTHWVGYSCITAGADTYRELKVFFSSYRGPFEDGLNEPYCYLIL